MKRMEKNFKLTQSDFNEIEPYSDINENEEYESILIRSQNPYFNAKQNSICLISKQTKVISTNTQLNAFGRRAFVAKIKLAGVFLAILVLLATICIVLISNYFSLNPNKACKQDGEVEPNLNKFSCILDLNNCNELASEYSTSHSGRFRIEFKLNHAFRDCFYERLKSFGDFTFKCNISLNKSTFENQSNIYALFYADKYEHKDLDYTNFIGNDDLILKAIKLAPTNLKVLNCYLQKLITESQIEFRFEMRYHLKGDQHVSALISFVNGTDNYLASGLSNGSILVWNVHKRSVKYELSDKSKYIVALAYLNNDKSQLACAYITGSIKIFDLKSRSYMYKLRAHTDSVSSMFMLPNGDLVSASLDSKIIVWDLRTQTIKHRLVDAHTRQISSLSLLSDNRLASGSYDKTVVVWDLNRERNAVMRVLNHTGPVRAMSLMRNGDLATGSNQIIVFDAASWLIKCRMDSFTGFVYAMTALINGDLASGHDDSSIIVWDLVNRKQKYHLVGHHSVISSIVSLSNGQLASSSTEFNDIIVFL